MKIIEIKQTILHIKKSNAMQNELIQALAYVRNIVILGRGKSVSSELLMEELSDITVALRPAFQDMEHFLHVCDRQRAEMVLYNYIGTGFSKDLGRFLAGWEDIPSSELLGTVEIYIDSLRDLTEEKRTKKDEMISDLIYFPVVLNAMLVLLDFVYVAFFIEQQNMLSQLFM